MNVQEFIEQQYTMYTTQKRPSFLDIHMYDCSEKYLYTNECLKDLTYKGDRHCYYLITDKKKIFFLLEVYKNTIFYHKEFADYINQTFQNGLIHTLFEILEKDENGKVEKG